MFDTDLAGDSAMPIVATPEVGSGKKAGEARSPVDDTRQTSFPTDFLEMQDDMLSAELIALRKFFERS